MARRSVRCVAISGGGRLGSASYLAIAAKAGAAATLEKPFTAAQLREAVSAALR